MSEDKYRAALDMGNALALGGIIRNFRFVNLIFDQHIRSLGRMVFALSYHILPRG